MKLTVNGTTQELDGTAAGASLLEVLREHAGLAFETTSCATTECEAGTCGGCTVWVDGRRVRACRTMASSHDGSTITTLVRRDDGGARHPIPARPPPEERPQLDDDERTEPPLPGTHPDIVTAILHAVTEPPR